MDDHVKELNKEERQAWRKKSTDELVRRGWTKHAMSVAVGMETSTALFGYLRPGGTAHGRHGYALDNFLVEALAAGGPEDYKVTQVADAVSDTARRPSRERLDQVRTGLKYLMDIVDDIEREMNDPAAPTATGTGGK